MWPRRPVEPGKRQLYGHDTPEQGIYVNRDETLSLDIGYASRISTHGWRAMEPSL